MDTGRVLVGPGLDEARRADDVGQALGELVDDLEQEAGREAVLEVRPEVAPLLVEPDRRLDELRPQTLERVLGERVV